MKLIFRTLIRLAWLPFGTTLIVLLGAGIVLLCLLEWARDDVDFSKSFDDLCEILVEIGKDIPL